MIEILNNRAVLHVVGADAGKFLQGMTTNNIIKNTYSYNYLLTNQGKYLFDFFSYQQNEDSYFLDVHEASAAALLKRLLMYKLRSDVEVSDVSAEHDILYSRKAVKQGVEYSFHDPRYEGLGYRSMMRHNEILNRVQDDSLTGQVGGNGFAGQEWVDSLYSLDKYEYAIIDGYSDLAYDRSIPIEYGAEELHAIDYHKGCYVGQEVISRVKYQGVVRKKIFKLQSDTEIIATEQGAEITDLEGNKIGVMCSAYGKLAIALLREEKFLELEHKRARIGTQIVDIEITPWR